jgi:hypothetical protein
MSIHNIKAKDKMYIIIKSEPIIPIILNAEEEMLSPPHQLEIFANEVEFENRLIELGYVVEEEV